MATTPHDPHNLLILLSLLLITTITTTHAGLTLDPSDLKAFTTLQADLGLVNGQRRPITAPCSLRGVFCERRISNNSHTYSLKITRLVFKSKLLSGFLSPVIGKLNELKELSLPNNNLVGQLPPSIVDCKKLEVLDLGNNNLVGNVPSELSSIVRLKVLDLSFNKFAGNLSFLKHFPNLETLSLSNNLFSGKVPKSIRSFRNLQFLDLSGNTFLEGLVPASVTEYPKRYIFQENRTISSGSNSGSNGSSSASGPNAAQAPAPSAAAHKNKKSKRKLAGWILGFMAGAVAGSISGFVFSVMFRLMLAAIRGGGRSSGPAIFSPLIKKPEDLAFLEKEDALASLEIIGRGGCGEVYKVELPGSNGKMIAIKKVVQPPKDAVELADEDSRQLNRTMRQIKSEINTVGQIRHRNLLALVAHIPKADCHYLVYEFMKNGSLQDILHRVSQGNGELDWLARHRIALGVASGLEYLHVSHSPRIIHRDLKPANILLDDDMEARIADFGLAKTMPDANTHVTASNVAGTVGYIAPEYHQTVKFTDKCDIYSFGVILGALVMGKLPSDEFFQNTKEMSMVRWMRNIMTSENPKQAIDPKLLGNGYEDQMLLVLKIACFCTLENPKERPSSKDVRCMLAQIIH